MERRCQDRIMSKEEALFKEEEPMAEDVLESVQAELEVEEE